MANGPMTHPHNGEFPMESLSWLYQVLRSGGKDFTLRDAVHHLHHLMAFVDAKLQPVVFGASGEAEELELPAKAVGAKAAANQLAKAFPQLKEEGGGPVVMGADEAQMDPATIIAILTAIKAFWDMWKNRKRK